MLPIELPRRSGELFNQETQEFIQYDYPALTLQLEHSLRSISKWEGKWTKPFFGEEEMTLEELRDYVRCMTLNGQKDQTDPAVYFRLTGEDYQRILTYMAAPMSAKTFPPEKKRRNPFAPVLTSEDYYQAMAYYGIPFECENWHINRLLALIKTCESINGGGEKKMTFREQQSFYDQINEARLKKLNTRG